MDHERIALNPTGARPRGQETPVRGCLVMRRALRLGDAIRSGARFEPRDAQAPFGQMMLNAAEPDASRVLRPVGDLVRRAADFEKQNRR